MPAKSFSKTILQISNKSRSLGWDGADMGGLEGIAGRGENSAEKKVWLNAYIHTPSSS